MSEWGKSNSNSISLLRLSLQREEIVAYNNNKINCCFKING